MYRCPRHSAQTGFAVRLWCRPCSPLRVGSGCMCVLALGWGCQSGLRMGQRFGDSRCLEKSRKRRVNLRQCFERRAPCELSSVIEVLHPFSKGYRVSLPVVRSAGDGGSALASVRVYVSRTSRSCAKADIRTRSVVVANRLVHAFLQ
jgi:hypothetical protein